MKKKMWFVLCIMTSVLLTTACGEKKETAVQTETTMQTETAVSSGVPATGCALNPFIGISMLL